MAAGMQKVTSVVLPDKENYKVSVLMKVKIQGNDESFWD